MPGICRLGDMNNAGGKLMRISTSVFIDGRPAILHPSWLTPHMPFKPPHNMSWTIKGTLSVSCQNQSLVTIGTPTTCGHIVVTGSTSTFCGP